MKKIRICMGTSCYVAGSSNLIEKLELVVKEKYSDKVEVVSSGCLGLCVKNWESPKPPYVKIDDKIIEEATVDKILRAIDN